MTSPSVQPGPDLLAAFTISRPPVPVHVAGRVTAAFQPLVCPPSNPSQDPFVFGVEALVRLSAPGGHLLGPADVFASGVSSSAASLSVLDVALSQRALVPSATSGRVPAFVPSAASLPAMSVNLTADLFASPQLVAAAVAHCQALSLPPSALMVELLESDPLDGLDVPQMFAMWSDAGFLTAVDDFPAGFATAEVVLAARPTVLKLDRDVLRAADAAQVVSDARALADRVGSLLLAEGVETAQQARMLPSLGVDIQQGFFHGRPQPSLARALTAPVVSAPAAPSHSRFQARAR